jgi:GH15 family glucan-1,4-alpha-glucosidase
MLAALDSNAYIRDLTYPRIGVLNHLSGNRIRVGVWTEGSFRWLSDSSWTRSLRYDDDALATRVTCRNEALGLEMVLSDVVLHRTNVLLRHIELTSTVDHPRELRLFLSHDFNIAETDIGDTAFYNPFLDAVIHYKRDVFLLISGRSGSGGIFQYTTGVKGFRNAEGTWRDAEDGLLAMNPIEQGSVDSTVAFRADLPACGTAVIHTWLCAGSGIEEVTALHESVLGEGFDRQRQATLHYWSAWMHCSTTPPGMHELPQSVQDLYQRSRLITRAHIDNDGAIIAAIDSDIMETARAHYAYMWPRDGALVAAALDRLGYQDITRSFFTFCCRVLPIDRPALMHKYSADGGWGASWHPWIIDGHAEIPFQEDGTALVLWALWNHYQRYGDLEFIEPLFSRLVAPAADFMVAYRHAQSGLPLPSYDLWEERRGIHAFTCGAVYGALKAAAHFAGLLRDSRVKLYHAAMEEMRQGMDRYLWSDEHRRFARRLILHTDSSLERDMTIDSAVYGLFRFGAYPAADSKIASTMQQVEQRLEVNSVIGGIARYETDYYFRPSNDFSRSPGNPWIICTLWMARYRIEAATTLEEVRSALPALEWVAKRATESGALPEQVDPDSGTPLSVMPLTWSHAEFIDTVHAYVDRIAAFKARPA